MVNEQSIKINFSEQKLRMIIKDSVKESIKAEIVKLRTALLPFVDDVEQKEIEKKYGKPSRKIAKSYELEI